ncbi:16S rRNA (uracil(1498)-N(3))-methyltransferase [Aquimarina sp. ERC-38]|uniref:16S rRNA (uracil(1498)-N(3))-methyltransferase n=1 Tax=Aquimarina sp. ERC-38 TaxID=2949996 RepID=UPI002247F188|nr:16S rRNA (uracil(1498)-N(3))-methyltransferase [Aquimarina sp. ERC-38]UZO79706.1 16S rRNA (uracil(1498)-N(3))-methyltransferase [Aquimarina sp. ERC-38]
MQLFYTPFLTKEDSQYAFSKEESRHISKVLRKKEGDEVFSTDGKGTLYTLVINSSHNTKSTAYVANAALQNKIPYRLHMAVAPTKMNDRYEWFLEKATEIGVTEITPIICEHSERKIIKPERFERILQSAMKQSLQCYLPVLNPAISYPEFIRNTATFNGQKYIAHCEDSDKKGLATTYQKAKDSLIIIGPEGDFSIKEIELALSANFTAITLGTNRLRTETAAIAAVHSISFLNQDN